MQILNAEQVRAWDQFTIEHEPISSIDLMERAAQQCAEWIEKQHWQQKHITIICGKGNNGGNGLAIARLLINKQYTVTVYILEFGKAGTSDFQQNLQRLHDLGFTDIHFIQSAGHFPPISESDVVIDALFGSGLNKPLRDMAKELVEHVNRNARTVVAIDIPSGLFLDRSSAGNTVIKATHTLSFQSYKLGLLVQENAFYLGNVHILNIGLHEGFLKDKTSDEQLVDKQIIKQIFKPRNRFAHKGNFGHALIVAGSYGKMGAAVMTAKACLRSGAGLTTAFIPKCGYAVMQATLPEAMVMIDNNAENSEIISSLPDDIEKFSSIGIGPGIGTKNETQKTVAFIIHRYKNSLVIDADGLNCLSQEKELLPQLPSHSIITPHPKEFERLFGEQQNDFERIETAKRKAVELNIVIVLKGHHTLIATPEGKLYFNCTGNAGMAKGGSGDVLTGIITALVAQKYTPAEAAILGVYLHGLAGDYAAYALSKEAMIARDIINYLPQAFLSLE